MSQKNRRRHVGFPLYVSFKVYVDNGFYYCHIKKVYEHKNEQFMEFKKAKQILNKSRDKKLTDEQVIEILKFIELLANMSVNNFLKSINKNI